MHESATARKISEESRAILIGMVSIIKAVRSGRHVVLAQPADLAKPLRNALAQRFVERIESDLAEHHARFTGVSLGVSAVVKTGITPKQAVREFAGESIDKTLIRSLGHAAKVSTADGKERYGVLAGVHPGGANSLPILLLLDINARSIAKVPLDGVRMEFLDEKIFHEIARKKATEHAAHGGKAGKTSRT
jgi:hypothetical protein